MLSKNKYFETMFLSSRKHHCGQLRWALSAATVVHALKILHLKKKKLFAFL